MTEALPKGIVVNTENISHDIGAIDRVDVEDIAHLWRVYSANRALLEGDAGLRLENLFWRIWSNWRIYRNILGSTIARLFLAISEGSDFIRTTPTQSPQGYRSTHHRRLERSASPYRRVTIQEHPLEISTRDPETEAPKASRQPSDSLAPTPPPILKKSRSGSDEPPKTARIVSPTQTHTPHFQSHTDTIAEGSNGGRAGKKKTSFVANVATSRRRPAAVRRKSSQTTTHTAPPNQPSLPYPPPSNPTAHLQSIGTAPAAGIPVFSPSPHGESWQDVESTASSAILPSTQGTQGHPFTGDQPLDWLVDRDFRARFVDRQIRDHRVSVDSTARPVHGSNAEGKQPMSQSSVVDEDDGDDDVQTEALPSKFTSEEDVVDPLRPLPRTKSQLSFMIERERRSSEGSGKEKAKVEDRVRKTSS